MWCEKMLKEFGRQKKLAILIDGRWVATWTFVLKKGNYCVLKKEKVLLTRISRVSRSSRNMQNQKFHFICHLAHLLLFNKSVFGSVHPPAFC